MVTIINFFFKRGFFCLNEVWLNVAEDAGAFDSDQSGLDDNAMSPLGVYSRSSLVTSEYASQ